MPEPEKKAEENPTQYHFVCLPYLNMKGITEIDFGFAKIWNFDKAREKYIPDPALRGQLERSLCNYRASYPYPHRDGQEVYPPVSGIGVVSTDADFLKPLDGDQRQRIKDARLILFMSF